jgi:hypothetical protein
MFSDYDTKIISPMHFRYIWSITYDFEYFPECFIPARAAKFILKKRARDNIVQVW